MTSCPHETVEPVRAKGSGRTLGVRCPACSDDAGFEAYGAVGVPPAMAVAKRIDIFAQWNHAPNGIEKFLSARSLRRPAPPSARPRRTRDGRLRPYRATRGVGEDRRQCARRLTVLWDAVAVFLPKDDGDSCTRTYAKWEDMFGRPEDVEFTGWPEQPGSASGSGRPVSQEEP